jgi:hypothetical protein
MIQTCSAHAKNIASLEIIHIAMPAIITKWILQKNCIEVYRPLVKGTGNKMALIGFGTNLSDITQQNLLQMMSIH